MRFLSVGPTVCLRLPSDSVLRRTPLPCWLHASRYRAHLGLSPLRRNVRAGRTEPPMNKFTGFLMRLAPQAAVGSRTWSPNDKPYPLARSPFRIIPATGQVPYSMCTAEHCTQQSSPAGLPASTQCMPSALSASAGLHRHMWFYAALQELLPPVQTAPLPERVLIFPG